MRYIYKSKITGLSKGKLKQTKDYLLFTCYDASDIEPKLNELGLNRNDIIIQKHF